MEAASHPPGSCSPGAPPGLTLADRPASLGMYSPGPGLSLRLSSGGGYLSDHEGTSGSFRWGQRPFLALRWMFPLRTLSGTLCPGAWHEWASHGSWVLPSGPGMQGLHLLQDESLHVDPRQ
ncbi:hypothetical protein mRhiFer1_009711 [Rhinolophus ferrumequinum]|uniref:Uncharacterized protein n=1 Tax=Rhinolophus ferrumequinum TaxID=59479 RepID=A0A7J7QYN3_RHIFE|nr:hypothetical protein mRhiFer1_009711 [Rhinolophus ferrumequinum]